MALSHRLHTTIVRSLVARGRAPTVAELAGSHGCDGTTVRTGLATLAADHGAVLHPDAATRPDPVWVVHPFATAPTGVTVHHDSRSWFAPCVWCASGVVSLVAPDGPAEVRTTLGGEGDPVRLVVDGPGPTPVPDHADHLVHFPIPMVEAWRNVVHTCQVMQLFATTDDVDDWCSRRGVARGAVEPLPRVWGFGAEWYGRHADDDWRKWTVTQAAAIFARHGLVGPTWDLPLPDHEATARF